MCLCVEFLKQKLLAAEEHISQLQSDAVEHKAISDSAKIQVSWSIIKFVHVATYEGSVEDIIIVNIMHRNL